MSHFSANTDDGARLDIAVYVFWGGRFEKAFLDVRVFNPSAQSNWCGPLASVYRRHKQEKKRQYEQRVWEVEHATFTPLVMSSTGGTGRAATTFYERLASMVSDNIWKNSELDLLSPELCSSESIYRVYQGCKIIMTSPSTWNCSCMTFAWWTFGGIMCMVIRSYS